MKWLLSLDCLDGSDVAKTLHFSKGHWKDKTKLIYQNKLTQPALINQSAEDGGVFQMFAESSIGEIVINNTDGAFDFLADYAFDGRSATLTNGATSYSLGVVDGMYDREGSWFFSFNSLSETLNDNYPQSSYDAITWDTGLDGKLVPIVFGDVRNITPVLIDAQLGIYQVSSLSDCRVTAVYYDGQRLANYAVDGPHMASDTTIVIKGGTRGVATGKHIVFDGDETNTVYSVSSGISGTIGTITISPGLDENIADGTAFDVIDLYGSLSALQADAAKLYTNGTKLATKWGSYQGYFHLADAVTGVITVDCITQKTTFEVIESVIANCGISGLTVDDTNQTIDHDIYGGTSGDTVKNTINRLGSVGYYLNSVTPIKTLLDNIIKSLGCYYWFIVSELNIKVIDAPASTAIETISEYKIQNIQRDGLGLGDNKLPVKGWLIKYRKNWTVMTTVAGILGTERKELLGKDFQELDYTNTTTQTRHLLSNQVNLESYLNAKLSAELVKTQLNSTSSVRRDITNITSNDLSLFDSIKIGYTFNVVTDLYGYSSGRKFVCIAIDFNAVDETVSFKGFG